MRGGSVLADVSNGPASSDLPSQYLMLESCAHVLNPPCISGVLEVVQETVRVGRTRILSGSFYDSCHVARSG